MVSKEVKSLKYKLISLMVFLPAFYIPFTIHLSYKFDIASISLSGIGWIRGEVFYLICFVFITIVMMLYQATVFVNLSEKTSKWFKSLMLIGGCLMIIGACIPCGGDFSDISSRLHSTTCQIGSVLAMIGVTVMLELYCKEMKISRRKIAILYGAMIAIVFVAFLFLDASTLFETITSLLFLSVMLYVNYDMLQNKFFAKSSQRFDVAVSELNEETTEHSV